MATNRGVVATIKKALAGVSLSKEDRARIKKRLKAAIRRGAKKREV